MTPMKLSEAIRLGSMLHPQVHGGMQAVQTVQPFGSILGLNEIEETVGTCALGAAIKACGLKSVGADSVLPETSISARSGQFAKIVVLPVEWGDALCQVIRCPEPECAKREPMIQVIAHLNDDHRWDRERIAGFVESYEPILESHAAIIER